MPFAEHLVVFRYKDQPGMIGRVGTIFGEQGVNIVSAAVGAEASGDDAVLALTTDAPVPDESLEADPGARRLPRRPGDRLLSRPQRERRRRGRVRAMRAVVITRARPARGARGEERPDPPVGPGEVRIAVKAAGINFADTMARVGLYPDAPKLPASSATRSRARSSRWGTGSRATRSATGWSPARGSTATRSSSRSRRPGPPAAEEALVRAGRGVPGQLRTAYAALVIMGGLKAGERVLIHAAAGGVGISATQIAKGIGAEIFGTASPSKHDAIREQGVDHPIDYRNPDFEEEVRRITGGEGVDVAMDALGPTSFRKDYRLLRPGGRLIMFGASELQTGAGSATSRAALQGLARMPLATMPWWKSLGVMNENKGVFGLNMLHWWDREGSLDRVTDPLMAGPGEGRPESRSSPRRSPSTGPPTRTASSRSAGTSARSSSVP